jgi:hypothetical protein
MLEKRLFSNIVQLVFLKSVVEEQINTRSVLSDVEGILPFLEKILKKEKELYQNTEVDTERDGKKTEVNVQSKKVNGNSTENNRSTAGGPSPKTFFETIRWEGLRGRCGAG